LIKERDDLLQEKKFKQIKQEEATDRKFAFN
jgi:hypothetical protein